MRDVAEAVAGWRASGERAAVARVVEITGFGGRRAGEVLAVGEGAKRAGSLLGGAADSEIAAAAAGLPGVAAVAVIDVPIGDSEAVAAGLACGGLARVLVQDAGQVPESLWPSLLERRPVALATVVAGAGAGAGAGVGMVGAEVAGALVLQDDPGATGDGSISPPALGEAAVEAARQLLRAGRDGSRLVDHEEGSVFVEAFVPTSRIVVVTEPNGLADAIAAQANLLGWMPSVLDDLPAALEAIGELRGRDAMVVLSHNPELDTPSLHAAVGGSAYVGALGSRHTQGARRERLAALGVDEEQLGRIHGPIGLDIGSRTPEETAVSIFAEILAWRSGRDAVSLRQGSGPING